jgi:DNA-binding IclR family transcriptional regulator
MSRGDELRRFMIIIEMLRGWSSPGVIATTLGVNRSTVHRILLGIHEEVGLEKRKTGRVVEYRLPRKRRAPSAERQRGRR